MGIESRSIPDEVFDLLSGTTILGVLYGITFTLYCLCARSLYLNLQEPDKRHRARFLLSYISLLLFCATAYLVVNARMRQLAYINHRADFPEGPMGYEQSYSPTTNSHLATSGTLEAVIQILTMAVQIWRLWIIWSGTRYAVIVIILPVLLLLAYTALVIPMDIVFSVLSLDKLGISETSAISMITALYAIPSAFTTLVTGLIAGRLLRARRRCMKIMGISEAASPYLSIVAMLVESYILEAAWSLATAISFGLQSPVQLMFTANDSTIKIITYFLVVYRVENGRGWTKKTGGKLTSLRWNHGTQTTSDEASDIQSQVPTTPTIAAIDSLPTAHSDSAI